MLTALLRWPARAPPAPPARGHAVPTALAAPRARRSATFARPGQGVVRCVRVAPQGRPGGLCHEDAHASCCLRDAGKPCEVALAGEAAHSQTLLRAKAVMGNVVVHRCAVDAFSPVLKGLRGMEDSAC
jgi:hypothetical protein